MQPIYAKWNFQPLPIGPVRFCFKGYEVVFYILIQVLIQTYASKQWRSDQTPHSVASDLDLHYLHMSHKKDARHIWVKMQLFSLSHKSC